MISREEFERRWPHLDYDEFKQRTPIQQRAFLTAPWNREPEEKDPPCLDDMKDYV